MTDHRLEDNYANISKRYEILNNYSVILMSRPFEICFLIKMRKVVPTYYRWIKGTVKRISVKADLLNITI